MDEVQEVLGQTLGWSFGRDGGQSRPRVGTHTNMTMGANVGKTEMTILMIRLGAAGEIMIFYKPKLDEAIKTIQTIDFNVETTGSNERRAHRRQLQLHPRKGRNDEDTHVRVKGVTTDWINQLQMEASP